MSGRLPLIYVAAPYSRPDPVENTHRAIRGGLSIWEERLGVPLIPHLTLVAHLVMPRPLDYWYEFDLHQIDHCSALLRLPGESTGADAEIEHADTIGIPVFHSVEELRRWRRQG